MVDYWQSVEESDLEIDWRKILSLFVNNLSVINWILKNPPSLKCLFLIKYMKNMSGSWSLKFLGR